MLDATNLPDLTPLSNLQAQPMTAINESPYDYNTGKHIHKDFPARERALSILRRFNGTVCVENLDNSTTNYEHIKAKLTRLFNDMPPRRMNREKLLFIDNGCSRR